MKKLLIVLSIIAFSSISSSFAQGTKAEQRKAREATAAAQFDATMVAAIESGDFTFTAETVSPTLGDNYPINGPYTRVFVATNQLNVLLPYYTSSQPMEVAPMSIDFSCTDYKYSYSLRKGMYYVKIVANNVQNNQANSKMQNGRYIFNFEISPLTGNAFLTVTPNFNAAINYTGIARPNN